MKVCQPSRIFTVGLALFYFASPASSEEIRLLATKSTELIVKELGSSYERETGNKIVMTTDLPVATKRKIDAGATFDVAILSPILVEQLVQEGKIIRDTRADIVRVGIGLGVRKGANRPDISTVDAFKRTLLAAKSIAYLKEGNTGLYIAGLLERLGIAEVLRPKTKLPLTDVVSNMVANGEAEVGLTAISLLIAEPGVETVGPIPPELQFYITFTGGVSTSSTKREAARGVMKVLTGTAALPAIRANGMEPGR